MQKLKINKAVVILLCLALSITGAKAQSESYVTVSSQVNEHLAKQEYSQALEKLRKYNLTHPKEEKAIVLYAKILYWNKEFDKSTAVYEKAMQDFEQSKSLHYDYAKMLYEMHQFNKSKDIFLLYHALDKSNAEANYLLANLFYWNGQNYKAIELLEFNIDSLTPSLEKITASKELLLVIKQTQKPNLLLGTSYYWDSQPITKSINKLELAAYKSRFLAPKIALDVQYFTNKGFLNQVLVANSFQLNPLQLKIDAGIGFAHLSTVEKTQNVIGNVSLEKKFKNYVRFKTTVEQKVYSYTLSSLNTLLLEKDWNSSLSWGSEKQDIAKNSSFLNIKNWNAETAFLLQKFEGNSINNFYTWLLSPTIAIKKIEVRLGYVYSFSNAQNIQFTPVKSLSETLAHWNKDEIQGVYNPYFTPNKQQIHSVLAQAKIPISHSISVMAKAKVAVFAEAYAPYIYLADNNGSLAFQTDSAPLNYSPFELNLDLNYRMNPKNEFKVSYTNTKAFFFTSQLINFQLKHSF